ncbi:hypothetical protein MMC13_002291 [Lambiella insularis]|nr:hypothetical protein [Lambiella insularis]
MEDLQRDPRVQNSVLLTWQISFNQIKEINPQAAELLSMMSVLDGQKIPEFLIRNGDDSLAFEDALTPLINYALVISEVNSQYFQMHPLVQLATKTWLRGHGTITEWEERAVTLLSEIFPFANDGDLETCRALLAHAEVVLRYHYSKQQSILQQSVLLCTTATFFFALGNFDLALARSQKALSIRRQLLKEEEKNEEVLRHLHFSGLILMYQGKHEEAEATFRQRQALNETISGTNHPDALHDMGFLAKSLLMQGKHEDAEVLQRRILAIKKNVLGTKDPETLRSMTDLALVLNTREKHVEAEALFKRTLGLEQTVLGTEHPYTLFNMTSLSFALIRQSKYEEAEAVLRRTLTLQETLKGLENPDTLTSVFFLADVLSLQKRHCEASILYERAYTDFRRTLGPDYPHTMSCLRQLVRNEVMMHIALAKENGSRHVTDEQSEEQRTPTECESNHAANDQVEQQASDEM